MWKNLLDFYNASEKEGYLDKKVKGYSLGSLDSSYSRVDVMVDLNVDKDGTPFAEGFKVLKKDSLPYNAPVTEKSVARSGGAKPNGLVDNIEYVAKDYSFTFLGSLVSERFEAYRSQLEGWAKFKNSPSEVAVVYDYIMRGSLLSDMQKAGVLVYNSKDVPVIDGLNTVKEFSKVSIGFSIKGLYVFNIPKVRESWSEYQRSLKIGRKDVCCLTGEFTRSAASFPAKVRGTSFTARFCSDGVSKNSLAYKGIFWDKQDCFNISYIAVQKVHSALRWLMASRGIRNMSEMLVIYAPSKPGVVFDTVFTRVDDLLEKYGYTPEDVITYPAYMEVMGGIVKGFRAKYPEDMELNVIAVDTADGSEKGRLAISYFADLTFGEYMDAFESWVMNCVGRRSYATEGGKVISYLGYACVYDVVTSSYATSYDSGKAVMSDLTKKYAYKKVYPCVFEGTKIPSGMLHSAFRFSVREDVSHLETSNTRYKNFFRAMYNYNTGGSIVWLECKDKSYLYGRAVAIIDFAEKITEKKSKTKKKYPSQARRMEQDIIKYPDTIFNILYGRTKNLFVKTCPESKFLKYLESRLNTLMGEMEFYENKDEHLSSLYSIGFIQERGVLYSTWYEGKKEEEV